MPNCLFQDARTVCINYEAVNERDIQSMKIYNTLLNRHDEVQSQGQSNLRSFNRDSYSCQRCFNMELQSKSQVLNQVCTSLKPDIQCSSAELVYGTTLRLSEEFFTPRSSNDFSKSDCVQRLSVFKRTLPPVSTRIQHRQVALPRELYTCSHVFTRVDSVRKPLLQPYEVPFHVIARHEKTFKVERHECIEIVSIARLKPAHVDDSALSDNLRLNARPIEPISGIPKSFSGPTLDTPETSFSRSGQQHASFAPSTDEKAVSCPDQQTSPPLTSY
ncbi:unnamed protein product [Schistosoma margrebowiei]|uniref:Uncharacterized protein n=1 Tax=Schistosoma margrebowiei TaxID=48269 RepID=A0A183M135_9TREM|nr:unnamed protein product [Schistosoma margrebowiei]